MKDKHETHAAAKIALPDAAELPELPASAFEDEDVTKLTERVAELESENKALHAALLASNFRSETLGELKARGKVFVLVTLEDLEERWQTRPQGAFHIYMEGNPKHVEQVVGSLAAYRVEKLRDGNARITANKAGEPFVQDTMAANVVGIVRAIVADHNLQVSVTSRGSRRGATIAKDLARDGGGVHVEQGFTFAAIAAAGIDVRADSKGALVLHREL